MFNKCSNNFQEKKRTKNSFNFPYYFKNKFQAQKSLFIKLYKNFNLKMSGKSK